LQIKFVKFPVDPANAAYNVLTLAAIDQSGQAEPDGNFNLTFGALWQAQANIAAALMIGVLYPGFESDDTPVPMWLDLRWSKNPQFDVGGRVGTGALDDFGGRVFFSIYTAYRI
jgi:hypothetical protein